MGRNVVNYIVFILAALALTYLLILAGVMFAGWCDRWID